MVDCVEPESGLYSMDNLPSFTGSTVKRLAGKTG